MIRSQGWAVALEGNAHHKPRTCASCGAPRKKQVVLQTSRRSGNVTTILRMQMPYCTPCASRVRGAGIRMMVLYAFVTAAMVVVPSVAGVAAHEVGVEPLSLAVAAVAVTFLVSLVATLVLLPKMPAAPATARGEAASVTQYHESGRVDLFCTNADFAQKLAVANRAVITPASRFRFVELGALAWSAVLAIGMVAVFVEAPAHAGAGGKEAPKKEAKATAPDRGNDAPGSGPAAVSASASASAVKPPAPPASAKGAKVPSKPAPKSSAAPPAPKKAK